MLLLLSACSSFVDKKLKTIKKITPEKNKIVENFSSAKTKLKRIYTILGKETFHCSCEYSLNGKIDFSICGYKINKKYKNRANKIEWEHVVPASVFGKNFIEWKNGHEKCANKKRKKTYKGRKCLSKVNKTFQLMESDLYNLVPAIGQVNALRSNYDISEINGEARNFGNCDIEIDKSKKVVEPKNEIRGDIARIYLYMDTTYPKYGIITEKNKKIISLWSKKDPASSKECKRYLEIKKIQKNENIILKEICK